MEEKRGKHLAYSIAFMLYGHGENSGWTRSQQCSIGKYALVVGIGFRVCYAKRTAYPIGSIPIAGSI